MTINEDKVPINLEEALILLKEGLSKTDIKLLKEPKFVPAQLHFSLGMALRNAWSLWETDTILVKWFKQKYGIEHADDISGIILDCLHKDIIGKPRRDEELAKQYLDHWKKYK